MEFLSDGHAVGEGFFPQQQEPIIITAEEFQRLQEIQQLQMQQQQQQQQAQPGFPIQTELTQQQQQPQQQQPELMQAQQQAMDPSFVSASASIPLPSDCLPVEASMTKEELVRRLRRLAKSLQELKQEHEDKFRPLAGHLATADFFEHPSKDVRLLVACCLADLFRINAPEAPFQGSELLRDIFLFLTSQLAGLEQVNSPLFNRHFYLLENLAWVKSFNICLDLPMEMNQVVFCELFRLIFRLVNDQQTPKVRMFMLDMLCPLILEADFVSTELLAILLTQLLPSAKPLPNRRVAHGLAKIVVEKTATALQPYILKVVQFYVQSKDATAELTDPTEEVTTLFHRFYDVVYELHQVSPELLLPVLPEFRVRLEPPWSNKDRLEATQLICRLFNFKPEESASSSSSPSSSLSSSSTSLISRLPTLWTALLKRFKDAHAPTRFAVIQMTSHIFINHPQHVDDVVGPLRECGRDVDENIRFHVVQAILNSAKKTFSSVPNEAVEIVSERCLDKRFKIRKEAATGIAVIYNQVVSRAAAAAAAVHNNNNNHSTTADSSASNETAAAAATAAASTAAQAQAARVTWIPGKIMQLYFQNTVEDKLLLEGIMIDYLVPKSQDPEMKSTKLYELFVNLDETGRDSFKNYFLMQKTLRNLVGKLEQCASENSVQGTVTEKEEEANRLTMRIARYLPDPVRAKDHVSKFYTLLSDEFATQKNLLMILMPDTTYERAAEGMAALLKKCGSPTATNLFYQCMRHLLLRIQPVFIDRITVDILLRHVASEVQNEDLLLQQQQQQQQQEQQSLPLLPDPNSVGCLGLDLLLAMSATIPGAFNSHDSLATLQCLLDSSNERAVRLTLRILSIVGAGLNQNFPAVAAAVIPRLGAVIQAADDVVKVKCAVKCIGQFFQGCEGLDEQLETIWTELTKNAGVFDDPKLEGSVVAMGHLAALNSRIANVRLKPLVAKFFIADVMLKSRSAAVAAAENNAASAETHQKSSSPSSSSTTNANKKSWIPRCDLSRDTRLRLQVVKMVTRYSLALIAADADLPANQPLSQNSVKTAFSTMRLLGRILEKDGNISETAGLSKHDLAHLRLVAGVSFLHLASSHRKIAELMTNDWFIRVALLLNDNKVEVRQIFAKKLHAKLMDGQLNLQFVAIFCLAANDPNKDNKVKARKYLNAIMNQRRDCLQMMFNGGKMSNRILPHLLPDYVLPYALHLLAHDMDLTRHDNVDALISIRECIWFVLEPLVKGRGYSYDFFRKMIEYIKQCKDATDPDDEQTNLKMYAVCDLAMNLLMNKPQASNVRSTNSTAAKNADSGPALWLAGGNPCLPKKLFSNYDKSVSNSTVYLPPELTGGSKQTGTRTVNTASKDMSVINTTATLVIRQADDDDDDDEDDGRREIHDILPNPENDDDDEGGVNEDGVDASTSAAVMMTTTSTTNSGQASPSSSSSSQQQQLHQQQSGRSSIISDIIDSGSTSTVAQNEENIPLAKRLKMS